GSPRRSAVGVSPAPRDRERGVRRQRTPRDLVGRRARGARRARGRRLRLHPGRHSARRRQRRRRAGGDGGRAQLRERPGRHRAPSRARRAPRPLMPWRRTPEALAVLVAAVLFATLPDAFVPGPLAVRYVVAALEVALGVLLIAGNRRRASIGLIAVIG